jgi:hypothetical protein
MHWLRTTSRVTVNIMRGAPARGHEPLRRVLFALQAARTAEPCGRLGWDYEMAGEPPARRWADVFGLPGKRRPLHLGRDLVPRLLELAAVPVPLGGLLSFAGPGDLARGVLLRLCWRQAVVSGLGRPLRGATPVRAGPDAAGLAGAGLAPAAGGR